MKSCEIRKMKSCKEFNEYMNTLNDFEMIGEYNGQNKHTTFKCLKCGNIWNTSPYVFKKSIHKCPECSKKKVADKLRHDKDEVFNYINKEGYDVLTTEYKNEDTLISVRHRECGHEYKVTYNNFKGGRRCPECANEKRRKGRMKDKKHYMSTISHFSDLDDYILGDYNGIDHPMKVIHKVCGHEYNVTPNMFRRGRRCPYCRDISIAETRITKKLDSMGVNFVREYKFDDLKSVDNDNYYLRYDFGILDNNNQLKFLIEYDGKQHFECDSFYDEESFTKLQKNDKLKNEYCENNNIKLYRIHYSCFSHIENYIEQILKWFNDYRNLNEGVEYIQVDGNTAS